MLLLANIAGFISTYRRYFVIGAIVLLLLLSVFWFKFCRQSALEQRIEDRNPVIVEVQTGANQAINAAVNANIAADDALENVNRVTKQRETNVAIDAANKNRCRAFPDSAECK